MNYKWILPAALLGSALSVFAQQDVIEYRARTTGEMNRRHVMIADGEGPGVPAAAGAIFFIAAGNADGKVVKNAPYSAESVTETTRILADGTRIANKNSSTMSRDKDGRTRRENELGSIGPFGAGNQTVSKFVTITDPVSKEVSILNVNEHTAQKVKMGEPLVYRSEFKDGDSKRVVENQVQTSVRTRTGGAGAGSGFAFTTGVPAPGPMVATAPAMIMRFDSKNSKTEDLGEQTMEGVRVKGTRVTMTIPSGEIGNDRDIVSTTERWYSPELEMVILTKTVDPQFGETTYRVTNLRRADPDPSLFRVPMDYKIQEGMKPMMFNRKVEGPGDEIF